MTRHPVSVDEQGRETRYEVSLFVGPCSPKAVEALAEAIMGLPEFTSVYGGAVGMKPYTDEDDDLAREVVSLREALRAFWAVWDDYNHITGECGGACTVERRVVCSDFAAAVEMFLPRAALSSVPESGRS